MSIKVHATHAPLRPAGTEVWGEVGPEGALNPSIRFALGDRMVCVPTAEIKRWEHIRSDPERLVILTSRERVTIVGHALTEIRGAMDRLRLRELRVTPAKSDHRPGPQIHRIEIEAL